MMTYMKSTKERAKGLTWDLFQAVIFSPVYYWIFELLLYESLKFAIFDQSKIAGKALLLYMSFTAFYGLKFAINFNKKRMLYPLIFEMGGCLVWIVHIPAMIIFSFLTGWLFSQYI